jgi:Animal haem peroxidase
VRILGPLIRRFATVLDRRFGWDRLPRPLGVLALVGLRDRLRRENLHDTETVHPLPDPDAAPERTHGARTLDGSFTDLASPRMGAIGARFGRNVPLDRTFPEEPPGILEPSPRVVSRELLTRRTFVPATTLNLLAGAWLQFEVHDWFSHGKSEAERPWEAPLAPGDDWYEDPMLIPRTRVDPTSDDDPTTPPTYVTADSHWWDASQIYGSDRGFADAIRAGEHGRLRLDEAGLLPADLEQHVDLSGVAANFWVGLGILHTLFTREHNAICDALRADNPGWDDQRLYDTARLVNSALMAKIHTVEWTPAIIAHPTTRLAMNANWWGLVGERLTRRFGRIGSSEVLSGIPGSPTNHHGVPYSLTEEFVAVYRMHPLLPDEFTFRSLEDDRVLQERTFPEIGALHTRARLQELGVANALYSFGRSHPGAITLHNYPRFLQKLERPTGEVIDLAATDVMRIRERGVPRYNDFRELFHRGRASSFEQLTGNPETAEELRAVYGDVDRVDLMVGLYAEPLPKGFGFSDTAFRVFILMASRRLKSDRFFTRDYRPEVYSPAGFRWVKETTMKDVLLRHYPELAPALDGVENPFAPWRAVA